MKRNRKGFTLAELLIVVAIIAVLVAIAIPVFSIQLEKSREATDQANVRSAYASLMADYISGLNSEETDEYGLKTLTAEVTARQTRTEGTMGWEGSPGILTTMVDGKESYLSYDAVVAPNGKYTITINEGGYVSINGKTEGGSGGSDEGGDEGETEFDDE